MKTKEDIVEVLKEEFENGHSVDVAIDCLGGEIMGKCLHYLTHGARWIMIASLAGTKTEIDLKNIFVRNVRIIGSTLRSRKPEVKAQILSELVKKVFPKVESGEIMPTIHEGLPNIRWHDLRHITASLLILKGWQMKEISKDWLVMRI